MTTRVLVQVQLASGTTRRTCWVEPRRVRPGARITLQDSEDPARLWQVRSVSAPVPAGAIHRGWGGTDVPRGRTPRVV